MILSASGQCPTPTPPPNVSITALSPYTARFQVNPISPPTVGYMAERKIAGGTWEIINVGYPNGVFNDFYELLPGHTYVYRTRAMTNCNDHTFSAYTPEVSVTLPTGTLPNQAAPAAPTALTASYSNGVALYWTAGAFPTVPGQFQVFQVLRSENGTNYAGVNFTQQALLLDRSVFSGHTYYYKVRSFNGFGWATEMYFACAPNATDCGTAFTNTVTITIP